MLPFAYYLLKVIACSGILYGYYLIALRDRVFHKWNRFYLLAAVVLSIVSPLVKINLWQKPGDAKIKIVHLLQIVNSNDEAVYAYTKNSESLAMNTEDVTVFIYAIVSCLLLAFLLHTLHKINGLKKRFTVTVLNGIDFINTDAADTPFSFFNTIFWNNKIDINTPTGKKIFHHEIAHIQEKHSYDKMFMNVALIFFWINPLFWLMRKELSMIHEFVADEKSLSPSDTAAFAAMVLQATYPSQLFTLTSNFSNSPLKRRFAMLIKPKNLKVNYVSRLLALPLVASLFFAFTLKMKTIKPADYSGRKLTVIIDAGHGGEDVGAGSENGVHEKDITLSIAKKIKELNSNKNINIVLSRDEDKTITVKQRVAFATSMHADMFISIHLDAEEDQNTSTGFGILIPNNENTYLQESKLLGADINESFKNNYQLRVPVNLKQPEKGVWVLKANKYPAVLVLPGFISNQNDVRYLKSSQNHYTIAKNILNGIEKYARETSSSQDNTTFEPVLKDKLVNDQVFIDTGNKNFLVADTIIFIAEQGKIMVNADTMIYSADPGKALVNATRGILIVNSKIESNKILKTKTIKSKRLTIHSGDEEKMLSKYGKAARNGVFVFENATITDKLPCLPVSRSF